ncbi:MAG: glutaminyl-peptide cyclotransferase [Dongiaceae bacterium]
MSLHPGRALLRAAMLAFFAIGTAAAAPPPASDYRQVPRARIVGQTDIPVYGFKVLRTYPHDTSNYTEGLLMSGGLLYEGTGLYGSSRLVQRELASGRVLRERRLAPDEFGEGVTILRDTVYQLTYLSNIGFSYDRTTLEPTGTFRYPTQGWGLTTDGESLFMSNGSSAILAFDPRTMAIRRTIYVHDKVGPVGFLNELEYREGRIYANVWQTNFIAIIAPDSGAVVGWIDLEGLNPDPKTLTYPYVLNGIAIEESTGHLLVTGKTWPAIYEIERIAR